MDASNLLSHVATFREFPGLQVPSSSLKENIENLFPQLACCLTHAHDLIYINQAHLHVCVLNCFTVARQAPLSMGFSRQEYHSGLPCPSAGDLSDPGIETTSPMSSALADGFFTTSATWEALLGSSTWGLNSKERKVRRRLWVEAVLLVQVLLRCLTFGGGVTAKWSGVTAPLGQWRWQPWGRLHQQDSSVVWFSSLV